MRSRAEEIEIAAKRVIEAWRRYGNSCPPLVEEMENLEEMLTLDAGDRRETSAGDAQPIDPARGDATS